MTKHTPAPWQLIPSTEKLPAYVCADLNDPMTTEIAVVYTAMQPANADANARLIAAAPELLSALERLSTYEPGTCVISVEMLEQARAAIAKVRGNTN